MIAYIKGTIVGQAPTYVIIETAGGVAYHVNISLYTSTQLPTTPTCKLLTYYHVTENAHALYGFAQEQEKKLFKQLISVSGVGTNTAIVMLSSLEPSELIEAILSENVATLKSVKGIGLKTAKRIILDLKDKLTKADIGQSTISSHNTYKEEALTALSALGIAKPVAQKAIEKVLKAKTPVDSVQTLIKQALNNL